MPKIARIAIIALGVACGVLAVALWNDSGGDELGGIVILLGAVALALIVLGVVATAPTSRSRAVRTRPRRRR